MSAGDSPLVTRTPTCVLVPLQKDACVSQHGLPGHVHPVLLFPTMGAGGVLPAAAAGDAATGRTRLLA